MNVGRVSIGTIPSAGIVDVFSGEVANAADLGGNAAPASIDNRGRNRFRARGTSDIGQEMQYG
jgi:hypothetical protein